MKTQKLAKFLPIFGLKVGRKCARFDLLAVIAQVVEHRLGKTKVISANLINGSMQINFQFAISNFQSRSNVSMINVN